MPVVGRDNLANLGLCQDGFGSNKEKARLSSIMAFGKGAGLRNSPINLNESDRAMGKRV